MEFSWPWHDPDKKEKESWLPGHTRSVPEDLRHVKGVTRIYFPNSLPELKRAWVRPSDVDGATESVAWVATFPAEYEGRRKLGHVVFMAQGSLERPDTTLALGFSSGEWDAFLGGVRNDEFNRVSGRQPRRMDVLLLLALAAAGPVLSRERSGGSA